MKFKVIIEEGEDGWYVVEVPALPGCISQGKTKKEALENRGTLKGIIRNAGLTVDEDIRTPAPQ